MKLAPPAVQAWLSVVDAIDTDDPALKNLDPGERAAVSKGIEVTGTLGMLDLAARRNLVNLPQAIERLKQTKFRYRKQMIEELLAQHHDQ